MFHNQRAGRQQSETVDDPIQLMPAVCHYAQSRSAAHEDNHQEKTHQLRNELKLQCISWKEVSGNTSSIACELTPNSSNFSWPLEKAVLNEALCSAGQYFVTERGRHKQGIGPGQVRRLFSTNANRPYLHWGSEVGRSGMRPSPRH